MRQLSFSEDYIQYNAYEIVFFISYTLLLSELILSTSFFSIYIASIWKPLLVISMTLLLINEALFDRIDKRDMRWLLIILPLMAASGYNAGGVLENSIVICFALAFCGRKIKFERLAKITLFVSASLLIIIVSSAHTGIITDYIDYGARLRHYLGFKYPLFGAVLLANITKLWIYIRKQRFSLIEFAILALVNYWVYIQTNSRLAFYLTAFLLLVVIASRKWLTSLLNKRGVCFLMIAAFIIAASISFIITVRYDPTSAWMSKLNSALGGRLMLGKTSIEQYGISLFPNTKMQLVGNGLDDYGNRSSLAYNYVDCFYIQLLQKYGVLFFFAFLVVITYTMYKSYKLGDVYFLVIMAFIAAHCMIDDLLMYINYNTFWLATGSLIYCMPRGCSKEANNG